MHDCTDNPGAGLRGHRRLGEQLDLFAFTDSAPSAPSWLPNGLAVIHALTGLWRERLTAGGFEEISTPVVQRDALWRESGHLDKFAGGMVSLASDGSGECASLKPMSCPAHADLFRRRRRSRRELPVRYAECGLVHRAEPSGSLNGLLRASAFVQDDAHVFCAEAQIAAELDRCLGINAEIYASFDLAFEHELSLRPERRLGADDEWDRAEGALRAALLEREIPYEERPGEGAFYGPKIDVHATDRLGRRWQLGTLQLDLQLPRRLGLDYTDAGDARRRPAMLHRASFGSLERFIAILLEHGDGWLPLWLAPVAVEVLPVHSGHEAAADELAAALAARGLRARAAGADRSLGKRVRDASQRRVPVVAVLGDQEVADGSVALRRAGRPPEVLPREVAIEELAGACARRERLPGP